MVFYPCNYCIRVASSNGRPQRGGSKSSKSGRSRMDNPIGEPSEQKSHAHCYIPNSISIQLSNGEASSTDGLPHNMVYFTKEQFTAGLHLPIPSLLKHSFISLRFCLLSSIPMSSKSWWGAVFWMHSIN